MDRIKRKADDREGREKTSKRQRRGDEVLKTVMFNTSEDLAVKTSFDEMNIHEQIVRGIYAYGM